jgi:hypothetical protein
MEFNINNHEIGNENCGACWEDTLDKCDCGGLIHTEFGDESSDGDYWIHKQCDKCEV